MEFRAKVVKFSKNRLMIEIPKLYRKDFKKGTIVIVSILET